MTYFFKLFLFISLITSCHSQTPKAESTSTPGGNWRTSLSQEELMLIDQWKKSPILTVSYDLEEKTIPRQILQRFSQTLEIPFRELDSKDQMKPSIVFFLSDNNRLNKIPYVPTLPCRRITQNNGIDTSPQSDSLYTAIKGTVDQKKPLNTFSSEVQFLSAGFSNEVLTLKGLFEKFYHEYESGPYLKEDFKKLTSMELNSYLSSLDLDPEEFSLVMSSQTIEQLEKVRTSGGLKVAIDAETTVYDKLPGGQTRGFHYALLIDMAATYKLPLFLQIIDFTNIFNVNGTRPGDELEKPLYHYRPDVLKESSLVVASMTRRPWRESLFYLVEVVPSRTVLVGRTGLKISSFNDLLGLRIGTWKNTSFTDLLETTEKQLGKSLNLIYLKETDNGSELVQNGIIDLVPQDSLLALERLPLYPGTDAVFGLTKVEDLTWGVDPQQPELSDLIELYLTEAKKSGRFEKIWNRNFSMNLNEYLDLITFGED